MKKIFILTFLILNGYFTFSQIYQNPNPTLYGIRYQRAKFDSTILIPTICGTPVGKTSLKSTVSNQSAIVFDSCGNKLFVFNPKDSSWITIGSGSTIDSTVSNLINYYTKTASNARYLRKDTSGTIAGELTVNGLNTNFLNLKDSTLTKYVNLKTNATNSGDIYFPDGQNMGGGIYRSTVAYQNWVNALLTYYVKYSDTSSIVATKSDISSFPTTATVNAALALKENSITASNTTGKYWNGYKQFVTLNTDSITAGSTNKFVTTSEKATWNGKVDSIRLTNTGVLHTTPATFSLSGTTGVLTQTLANQSPFTLFRRGSGTGTPSFGPIDTAYFGGLWSYYVNSVVGASQWVTNGSNIYYSTGNVSIGSSSNTGKLDVYNTALTTTVSASNGLNLINTTAGTNAIRLQNSPPIVFAGHAWNTVTSSDITSQVYLYNKPISVNGGNSGQFAVAETSTGGTPNDLLVIGGNGSTLSTNLTVNNNTTLNGVVTISTGAINGALFVYANGSSATQHDGAILANSSTPTTTSGTPVIYSPSIRMTGAAWTGSASQLADFRQEVRPVSGSTPITSSWFLSSQLNGGGYTDRFQIGSNGQLTLPTIGSKINIATGTNAANGTATLSGGTVTVNTTAVTASSGITLTVQETGTYNGRIRVSARVANTSFTISSSDAGDNCTVYWVINN